jgi:hypothetical protein
MKTSKRIAFKRNSGCCKFRFKSILIFCLIYLSTATVFGQISTQVNGNWENTAVWPAGNHPTHNLPGSPDVVVNHDVRVHQFNLELGAANNGHLIINGRLNIETQLRVTRNNWEITVAPNAQLIVAMGVYFQQPGGGASSPDLVINGIARIDGGITGTGVIRGSGTLIVDFIGPGVNTGPFTGGGGTIHVTPNPLPIELLSFSAKAEGESVLVRWETATETNNDFFTIERSNDVKNWVVIGYVDGAGNSNRPLSYRFTDNQPLEGISYYRLRQTDYDGKYEYFGPVAVQFDFDQQKFSFRVFKQFDHWVIVLPGKGLHHVEVYNLKGHRLISQNAENNLTIPVQRGPVVIRVVDQNSRSASKVVKSRLKKFHRRDAN